MHTPVVTVGRFTMERIDPHGSLGALGDGEAAGEGELEGIGDVCPSAAEFIRVALQTVQVAATNLVRNIAAQL